MTSTVLERVAVGCTCLTLMVSGWSGYTGHEQLKVQRAAQETALQVLHETVRHNIVVERQARAARLQTRHHYRVVERQNRR